MSVWSARGQEKGEGTTAISVSFCNAHSLSQAVLTHSTYFSLKPLHLFWNNDEFENTIAAVLQVKVVGGEGFNVREGFLACFAYIYKSLQMQEPLCNSFDTSIYNQLSKLKN